MSPKRHVRFIQQQREDRARRGCGYLDPVDVEWAITTKSQTSSDTMTVERALFSKLDALSNDGISDEIGIGVTIALGADPFRFETIPIPDENSVRLKNYIDIPQCDPGDPGGKHSWPPF